MSMVLFFLFFGVAANAESFISCHDGDTCRFDRSGKVLKVRFSGIDAPESDQPFGTEARNFLVKLLKDKTIRLECNGKSWDREACAVFIGDDDIQKKLVQNGYAMDFPKYSQGKYKADEESAKSKKIGIWSKEGNTSPYCWRYIGTPECNKNKLYQPK